MYFSACIYFISINEKDGSIELDYNTFEGSESMVKIRNMVDELSPAIEYRVDSGNHSVSINHLQKGIYVIMLIEDGSIVDNRKVAI